MALNTKTFDQLVSDQANAMQGVARILLDFTDGSDFLATVQANAGNSLWLQALITALLAVARLQTSSGSDVDSFVEQFFLSRLCGGERYISPQGSDISFLSRLCGGERPALKGCVQTLYP